MPTLTVDQPIDLVRQHWMNPENYPDFIPTVDEVTDFGGDRYLWKVEVNGTTVRWMTKMASTRDRVEWEPTDGTDNRGRVQFRQVDDSHTEVRLEMRLDPMLPSADERPPGLKGWRVNQALKAYKTYAETGTVDQDMFDLDERRTELMKMPRAELYELARARNISGRSKMNKADLIEALAP